MRGRRDNPLRFPINTGNSPVVSDSCELTLTSRQSCQVTELDGKHVFSVLYPSKIKSFNLETFGTQRHNYLHTVHDIVSWVSFEFLSFWEVCKIC